jgi:hypothetical protein
MTPDSWTRNEPTTLGISHRDAEICLNCWYFTDSTGVVLRIAAKGYALTGTDDEKLAVLRALSATDYLTVKAARLPERFVVTTDGQSFRGAAPAAVLQENAIPYFDDLIAQIASSLPPVIHAIDDVPLVFRMELHEPFLWVSTCVYEEQDGSLIARISR